MLKPRIKYKRYIFDGGDVPRNTLWYRRRNVMPENYSQVTVRNEEAEDELDEPHLIATEGNAIGSVESLEVVTVADEVEDSSAEENGDSDRQEFSECSGMVALGDEHNENEQPANGEVNSDDDGIDEDVVWNKRQRSICPVCPCAQCCPEDVLIMCLTLGLRHNLSWRAQEDILKMVNTIYGQEKVPQSLYHYFSLVDRSGKQMKYHIYCKECERHLGNKDDLPEHIICDCGSDVDISKSPYFLSINLIPQMREILSDENTADSIMKYRFTRKKVNKAALEDIFDGAQYRKHMERDGILLSPYNFSFSFNTDGAQMGNSCGKSIWPIYVNINELPPNVRYKSKNILLSGLYVGPTDPNHNLFLEPFVQQCNDLSTTGFTWMHKGVQVVSKVIPLCSVVDSQARWKMLNMSGVNSYYACTFCYQKAVHTQKGQRFPPEIEKIPLRTAESTLIDVKRAFERRNHTDKRDRVVKGVKGPSPLANLFYFNLIAGFVPDYMHCILLGVARLHTNLLLECVRKRFWIDMQPEDSMDYMISSVDERLLKICSVFSITRSARKLTQRKLWKASEWRSWLLFYCIPCLQGLLKNKYLLHLSLLSKAVYILLQNSITFEQVKVAEEALLRYVFLFNKYFGVNEMKLDIHLITHITQSVLNWGPIWTHNTFAFEGANRNLLLCFHSPNKVCKQFARRYLIMQTVTSLTASHSCRNAIQFCENMLERKLQYFARCDKVILLGKKYLHSSLSHEEEICLRNKGVEVEKCEVYGRMLHNGIRYFCAYYVSEKRRNNDSCIMIKGNVIVIIQKIVAAPNNDAWLIVKRVNTAVLGISCEKHLTFNHVANVKSYGDLFCISPRDILCQCLFFNIGDVDYVSAIPYGCLGD
ncbi:uncharacterized protein LOC124173129 [Ischnura elegans]|uniref:uncharacterized protein LOC124173129 n=1 Tax=Ischnura elegans TaxID=197161 RepID=UPI001ED89A86|nr:uncharacterized protein LOC124173129 [Ischnura elegans]